MYFNYPFLKNNIVTFQDGRHYAYLSFVLHYFVQFSRCDFKPLRFEVNTHFWILNSNLNDFSFNKARGEALYFYTREPKQHS